MYFLCLNWSEMLFAHLHVPPIRETCMNLDVELTVFKIVFYEILNMLGIKCIIKTEFLQGSYTNLEFNT